MVQNPYGGINWFVMGKNIFNAQIVYYQTLTASLMVKHKLVTIL